MYVLDCDIEEKGRKIGETRNTSMLEYSHRTQSSKVNSVHVTTKGLLSQLGIAGITMPLISCQKPYSVYCKFEVGSHSFALLLSCYGCNKTSIARGVRLPCERYLPPYKHSGVAKIKPKPLRFPSRRVHAPHSRITTTPGLSSDDHTTTPVEASRSAHIASHEEPRLGSFLRRKTSRADCQ